MIFLGNSQYRQAESAFKKVIKADPSCVDAHYGLGKTYFEVGAFDDAKSAAEEAIQLNPQHIHSHDLLKMIKQVTHLKKKQIIRKKVLIYAAVVSIIVFGVYVANQYRIINIPVFSNKENNKNDKNGTVNDNDNGTKRVKPSNRNSVVSKPLIKVSLENKSDKVMIIAGEEKSIKLSINNKGDTLNNVKVTIDSKIRGLTFALPPPVSRIQKNRSHDVEIGIAANDNVKTGKPDLKVHLNDHHGNSIAKTDVPINILNLESVE